MIDLSFVNNGFLQISSLVFDADLEMLTDALETTCQKKSAAGVRNLLRLCDAVMQFATTGATYQLATELLGTTPRPVRGILFDKTPDSNWYVTWHQDLSIPVVAKVVTPGYGAWSVKDGVIHVQPPAHILEQMVSLRIHLDDCCEDNGAIKFIPGSHLSGVLDSNEIGKWREAQEEVVCTARRGDVIAMRPLILHASSTAKSPQQRRVLHLEYSAAALPNGLDWAMA